MTERGNLTDQRSLGKSMRFVWLAVAGFFLAASREGLAQMPAALPPVEASDLNGRALTLPRDLPGEKTLLIVAYTREQQADADTWVNGLGLKTDGTGVPWLEIPVVGKMPGVARSFVNNGMRGGIPEKAKRGHVVTLFVEAEGWSRSVGISSMDRVYALVVDRSGRVLARQEGRYEAGKGGVVLDALRK